MLLKIHSENPSERKIQQVVSHLQKGGIIIYPTDTVYALGCNLYDNKAIQKLAKLKGVKPAKANFSLVCHDLSQLADFTLQFDKSVYKLMRRNLPGPFTFILKASGTVPKIFKVNRKTIGIRVPANNIAHAIVAELGNPLVSTSLKHEDDVLAYPTDPSFIYEDYQKIVNVVIDGGMGDNEASTIVDCTTEELTIIRQGKGILTF